MRLIVYGAKSPGPFLYLTDTGRRSINITCSKVGVQDKNRTWGMPRRVGLERPANSILDPVEVA